MPPEEELPPEKSLQDVADELGTYPLDALRFVEEGLSYTVQQLHGEATRPTVMTTPEGQMISRHITGAQLCEGLRDYALSQWGLMAGAVFKRWKITGTLDFGRIVFALVDAGRLQKTDEDTLDDFRDVFDFHTAFDRDYRIEGKPHTK